MQIDSWLSIGASPDAPYVDSHEFHSPMSPRITRGYLKHYAEQVAPAAEGAVMPRWRADGSEGSDGP